MSANPVFGADGRNFAKASQQYATLPSVAASPIEQEQSRLHQRSVAFTRPMTADDVVTRTGAMVGVIIAVGGVSWWLDRGVLAIGGLIVGLILALVISFRASTNPVLIMTYAACEGLFLGAISRQYATAYHNIVPQAVIATAGVFMGMLAVYKFGKIRVTPRFNRIVAAGIFGVLAVVGVNLIASLVMGHDALGLYSGGPIAIGFTLLCIGLAAAAFLSDFDMIDRQIRRGAPEQMAWYAAFGLTVTLVWLYLEILRLIGFLRD